MIVNVNYDRAAGEVTVELKNVSNTTLDALYRSYTLNQNIMLKLNPNTAIAVTIIKYTVISPKDNKYEVTIFGRTRGSEGIIVG